MGFRGSMQFRKIHALSPERNLRTGQIRLIRCVEHDLPPKWPGIVNSVIPGELLQSRIRHLGRQFIVHQKIRLDLEKRGRLATVLRWRHHADTQVDMHTQYFQFTSGLDSRRLFAPDR